MEDPDNPDLSSEFEELNDDEVEELKRECVVLLVFICFQDLLDLPAGNAATPPFKYSTASSLTSRRRLILEHPRNSTRST